MSEFPDGPIQKLARREFDDPDVRKMLAGLDLPSLIAKLGQPHMVTRYAPTRGHWSQGDPLPALRDEDPAVMQAIGRCAVYRLQNKVGLSLDSSLHDRNRCAWCGYPLEELLRACDWGVFRSRYIEQEFAVWYADQEKRKGARYALPTRGNEYENPVWRAFFEDPERRARIEAAQYPEAAA